MIGVEVLVKLLAPDPWSFTVFDTLNRKFGLEEIVGIERIKSWDLEYDVVAAEQALEATGRILRETVLLANPNRDISQMRADVSEPAKPGIWKMRDAVKGAFVVKVRDMSDQVGDGVTRIARLRLGMGSLERVRFSTAWVIEMSSGESRSREIAGEVALLKSRGKGLLANPHSQEAEVLSAGAYLLGGEG